MHIVYLNNNTIFWFDSTNVIDYSHLLQIQFLNFQKFVKSSEKNFQEVKIFQIFNIISF